MVTRYLEIRGRIRHDSTNMVADIMRHFHARQHLGKAVVVCDDPAELETLGMRQWLKLSRFLQRQRGLATNAVEILKFTYTITQMQHVEFSAKAPRERPEANVYFVRPEKLGTLPIDCLSVYLTAGIVGDDLAPVVAAMPASGLLVDYTAQIHPGDFGLRPKTELETRVVETWQGVEAFLTAQQIDVTRLAKIASPAAAMDDALDALLGVSAEFLSSASLFQRTLDLARPLRTVSKAQRDEFEVFMVLAHRVQSLAPGGFSAQFLNTYADDTFFLNDKQTQTEMLAELLAQHELAGRTNLVRALMGQTQTRQRWLAAA